MTECLFDTSKSPKHFGMDANGLLTCTEADYARTHNPYVNLTKMAHEVDRIQAAVSVVNEVKAYLEDLPWFREAQAKGKIANDFTDRTKPQALAVGGFDKKDVLKAAYIAQSIRFSEHSAEYIAAILKSRIENNNEGYEQVVKEILKDMPKFEHPALTKYDPESFNRMKVAKLGPYKDIIDAFYRFTGNTYRHDKAGKFDKGADRLKLLSFFSEAQMYNISRDISGMKMKKKKFDSDEYLLKILQRTR